MNRKGAVAVIEASTGPSRLGLRSRIAEELAGKTVLYHTVSRVLRTHHVDTVWIIAPQDEVGDIKRLVAGLDVQFFPAEESDIPSRERLRRGRKWALGSWRGGLGHSYFACEAGNPQSLLAFCTKRHTDHVLVVPAEAPLVAPELMDELLETFYRDGAQKKLYLATSPPGLSGDLYSKEILETLALARRSVDGVLDFRIDAAEHYVDGLGLFHWYPNTISSLRARLCLDTDRGAHRVRAMVERLGEAWTTVPAEGILEALRQDPRLLAADFPQEFVVELTSRRTAWGPADGRQGKGQDLSLEHLERLLGECGRRDDVRLSLGILGDPFCHPRITEVLELIAQKRPFGLHIHTEGLHLTEAIEAALDAADPDVISVSFDAAAPQTYERLHGVDGLQRVTENTRRLARLQEARGGFLVPEFALGTHNAGEVETFYETWYKETGWVTVRDHDDLAGQRESLRKRDHVPTDRTFCSHLADELAVLPDGNFVLCRQDVWGTAPLGTIGEDAVEAIWRDRPLQCQLCPQCHAWAF